MRVRIGTELDVGPERVVAALRRVDTLARVARGMLAFEGRDGPLPDEWPTDGSAIHLRIRPFHLPFGWPHTIRIVELDLERGVVRSQEQGGMVRRWDHTITVDALRDGRSYYADEIEIDAGPLTPVIVAFAVTFYRWRQHRWRRLAATWRAGP